MSLFVAVYYHTLGYDSYLFSLLLTEYQCSCYTTGDVQYLEGQYWPSTVSLVGKGITVLIVQFIVTGGCRDSVISAFISSLLFKAYSDAEEPKKLCHTGIGPLHAGKGIPEKNPTP